MNPAVGIDLGTTNTVAAVQTDATGPRLVMIAQPRDLRNALEREDHIKSAVVFESTHSAVVGAFAARRFDAIDRSSHTWGLAGDADSELMMSSRRRLFRHTFFGRLWTL